MAIKEFWYRQDLDKPVQVRQMSGVLFTEDNQGDLIGVEVSKGGHPYELTGSVIGYIIKEDGVTESVNGTLSNSRAYITLPATALDVPGIIHIAIRVTNGSEKAVVCAVRGLVNRSRSEIVNTSGRTIYGIDDLLAQIAAMEQATTNANTATTDANNAASNANEKAGLANTAASNANEKAGLANTAANNANTAATKINSMTVEASKLASGASPTAQVSDVDGHKHIAFGIPKGDTGETGATPNLTIGTVSTLNPDQSASAAITGTAENPVLNLSLPRGQTGSITNAYGSNIPYSESDSRTVKEVVDKKLESVPVMKGATSSESGESGLVPVPVYGYQDAVLLGSGRWDQSVKRFQDSISHFILTTSSPVSIPPADGFVARQLPYLTEDYVLLLWRFSSSPENSPPTTLTYDITNKGEDEMGRPSATLTIGNSGVDVDETIQPVFIKPIWKMI